jgi:hypothetical protein
VSALVAPQISGVPADLIVELSRLLAQAGGASGPLSNAHVSQVRTFVKAILATGVYAEDLPGRNPEQPANLRTTFRFRVICEAPLLLDEEAKWYDCPFCKTEEKFKDGWIIICDDGSGEVLELLEKGLGCTLA